MKKILIVAYDYFPKPSANTLCISKHIDYLQKLGYEIDIVCVRPNKEISTHEYINGVGVYRVENRADVLFRELQKIFNSSKNKFTKLAAKLSLKLFNWHFSDKLEGYVSNWNTKNVIGLIDELYDERKYDKFITISLPYITNQIGLLIKNKYPDLEWIVYELDPFTYNYVLRKDQLNKRQEIEEKVCQMANKIISTHGIIEENNNHGFRIKFSDKEYSLHLPNLSYIIPTINSNEIDLQFDKTKINIAFTGYFYGKIRNPEYILKLLEMADDNRIVLHIFGGGSNDILKKFERKMKSKLVLHGQVDKEVADIAILKADILLNIGNDLPNQTPSKVFSYMGTGKPIINISYIDYDTSMFYLKKYGKVLNLNVKDEINDIIIQSFLDFCYSQKHSQYSFDNVNERMGECMSNRVIEDFRKILEKNL